MEVLCVNKIKKKKGNWMLLDFKLRLVVDCLPHFAFEIELKTKTEKPNKTKFFRVN